jgi:malonate decarboxylase epsilon subunit
MNVAYLFPGQGAQSAGFLHRLPEHSEVQRSLKEAASTLGVDIMTLDRPDALLFTVNVQLGLLIAGVAVSRALAFEGLKVEAVAGLSVGAFGAAVACGALSFADALTLVRLRGTCMEKAYPKGFGMAAIVGLDERQVQSILERVGGAAADIYIANINAPTQIVVSGAARALDAAVDMARACGARRAEKMAVSVPSHSPLLDGVSAALEAAMLTVEVSAPQIPYISNRRARAVHDAAGVREDLILNVSNPVRWHDSVTVLYELGVRCFIELPPGKVLTALVEQAFPEVRALAADDALPRAVVLAMRSFCGR